MSKLNVIGLAVVALVLLTIPLYFNPYMTQIAITTLTYSMLGLAFALGIRVGLPRLDLAAWWGVGGYTTAILMKAGVSFWVTVLAGGTIAVVLGGLLFALALPRGVVTFFIFCMVLSMTVYQIFGTVSFFGGWGGITDVPKPTIFSLVIDSQMEVYYVGLFFLALSVTVYYLLYHSRIGRAWDSISSSVSLAQSIGVDVVRYRLANVLIGNFFIAVAGSFFVSYFSAAMPDIFTFNAGVNTIVFLFIGGFGHSLIGPVLGAVIATFIPEYFRFTQQLQSIITSVIVILILMFLPMGVLGIIDKRVLPLLQKMKWWTNLSGKETGSSEPVEN